MANKKETAVPLTEEQPNQIKADIDAREQLVAAKEQSAEDAKKVLDNLNAEISAKTEKLSEIESLIDEKAEELAELEIKLENRKIKSEEPEVTTGLEFTLDNEDHKFKDDAPQVILFNGKERTQEELANDESAILQIVAAGIYTEKL
ncbi:hypothetical protein [Elizabethkingia anophelis]|uniref:hypothetical protein n=1 Tax=Elizabethkingia anophelis TaxID=1117645 RepID=UPI002225C94A|nr:hypothetical protein [Elizabethkingia anophelis]MCW2463371.1 septal ring factor EnvC (AmiA/AmiB activator) [Elizabethkingia anophelis]MCW2467056.1 septal ring factor EnvC (AmiA/AmiB activator) [Elizabethkingia anophelis]MCW2470796.1 septal ring factor EnvC (AmiA/AmiB activator) [Elizabethkingia anophelis]HBI9690668.1 hypothetical protein [Elizabethkingia anophelis]HBI9694687.1 hypothetical protein [Elizabethkingia anophelis]